ncbi:hypothetical protein AAU57_08700 [Nonlabens sp. YIK11]|uniref:tetratricopeptide repeat protein n=1 Tax=Nonlabens sp. YIK11 TaxID=1453349 RepID=UPI0007073B27|nr:tetratricopeptide repeat protein [Nonlabens sp. YIK11]KQC33382.1 hypothetical protein AAU57_08700 [Nonlabens sp. YIK11]
MTIVIARSEFLSILFPNLRQDQSNLIDVLKDFYSIGSTSPEVEISDDFITIKINIEISHRESDLSAEIISLCEQDKITQALPLAKQLVKDYPKVSEYHRLLGQIQSELGNQEEGINALIDSLRWNPKNQYALIMMGNIFARHKGDIDTALIYYNEVLKLDSDDYLALNNIGANLLQLGRLREAKEYFHKAIFSNPNYPNTYYGLAIIAEAEQDYADAFDYIKKSIKNNESKDEVFKNSIAFAKRLSETISKTKPVRDLVRGYVKDLELKYNTQIKIEEDDNISTAAKLELKENYDRDYHLVRYQSKYSTYLHLIVHELIHLELAEDARIADTNHLFTSNQSHKSKFFHNLESEATKLYNNGISKDSVANYFQALHNGLNSQVFNTPIDLFIEDIIFQRFKPLRPIQFYSLYVLINEGVKAVTQKEIVERTPKEIIRVSKIYNLIHATHFKTLFGIDLTGLHKPNKIESDTAKKLYDEFLEYREDRESGEEYELIQHWAEDLKMDGYFDLILESKYRSQSIDDVIESVNSDPFNLSESDPSQERKMRSFVESHTSEDVNMAVVMYMVSALEYLKEMSQEKIKKIAFEFATVGMQGIDPNKGGYHVPSIPNSNFSGYKTLAFYYVTWAKGIPDMLGQLQMPFDKEYELATAFLKK